MFLGPKSRLNGIEPKFSLKLKPLEYRKIWVGNAEKLLSPTAGVEAPGKFYRKFISNSCWAGAVESELWALLAFSAWAASGLLKAGSFGQLTEYWVATDANIRLIIECVSECVCVCWGATYVLLFSLSRLSAN